MQNHNQGNDGRPVVTSRQQNDPPCGGSATERKYVAMGYAPHPPRTNQGREMRLAKHAMHTAKYGYTPWRG